MRKSSLLFFATALFFVGSLSATTTEDLKPTKKLAHQILKMLETNSFDIKDDMVADVRFTINKEGEIVVLSVDTEVEVLENFVKARLNYQKVELENAREGQLYTVPIRITV